jgi:hypothetical protein
LIAAVGPQKAAPRSVVCAIALAVTVLSCVGASVTGVAQTTGADGGAIKAKNLAASRDRATRLPRSEGDQAIVDGWPLYRTERGQAAFNDAMATLQATNTQAPLAKAFKDCPALDCNLSLPALRPDGWIPSGRLWVSPDEYILIVHSPRQREGQSYRRRMFRDMKYFVFHEFHNSSRNTDLYDTVSSHKSSVFVPFYMSKTATDAYGRRYVIVMQVAPHDVLSIHASNKGSSGPGIEVARNVSDAVEPLQNLAGIVVAVTVATAAPRLSIVNHRGTEGLPMLNAYERRQAALRGRSGAPVVLPFVPASAPRLAAATGRLDDLILRRGASPRIPVAERGVVPPRVMTAAASNPDQQLPTPTLIGPIRLATRPAGR